MSFQSKADGACESLRPSGLAASGLRFIGSEDSHTKRRRNTYHVQTQAPAIQVQDFTYSLLPALQQFSPSFSKCRKRADTEASSASRFELPALWEPLQGTTFDAFCTILSRRWGPATFQPSLTSAFYPYSMPMRVIRLTLNVHYTSLN